MTGGEIDDEPLVVDAIEKIENFYRGTVCKLHRSPERGRIRTASGREIPFTFSHVTMAGSHRRFDELREGMEVGYDVGWTSKGLRVHVIWIPEAAGMEGTSERQGGSEQNEAAEHLADEDSQDGDVE